jgi:proteasome lid subunit RPN8/RPN11
VTQATQSLVLSAALRDEIIAHARSHTPRECCGIVSGHSGTAAQVHPLTNLEPGVTRYLFDDEEFFRVYWEIENRGDELVAVYHSHPATVAYPSVTDIAFAFWPEAVYIICSLRDNQAPVIRGFRIVEGNIMEIDLA